MSNIDQIDAVTLNLSRQDLQANNIEKGDAGILRRKAKSSANNSTSQITGSNNEIKSKKPKNTRLKQQQLPAWQPILTAGTVLPLFFTIGVIFIVLGGVLLHYSNTINELVIDYTNCKSDINNTLLCSSFDYVNNINTTCTCTLNFTLSTTFEPPVYIYYGLKNFYQNHRRYVKSRDDNQLLGKAVTTTNLNADCSPYDYALNNTKIYAPCGAIANSLFNDKFNIFYNDKSVNVSLLRTGIAWTSDKNVKFANPNDWLNTIRPKRWRVDAIDLDTNDVNNTGYKNEDLIVWMRTAALPNFRKFYRRVDHTMTEFTNGLPKGTYTLKIDYNFPVTVFEGSKSFIISTTSWIGGKNPFLGIAYLVIGSLCMLLGIVFLVIHIMYGKKINEEFNSLKPDS